MSSAEWNCSVSAKSTYRPRVPPIYHQFWSAGPTFHLSAFPTISQLPMRRVLRAFPSLGVLPSDARLARSTPFPIPGLPGATLTSCAVSMGLSQCALTEVLVVLCRLPWPLVQGVFDCCFGFHSRFVQLDLIMVL